jgi:hypothetical protein
VICKLLVSLVCCTQLELALVSCSGQGSSTNQTKTWKQRVSTTCTFFICCTKVAHQCHVYMHMYNILCSGSDLMLQIDCINHKHNDSCDWEVVEEVATQSFVPREVHTMNNLFLLSHKDECGTGPSCAH